MFKIHRKKWAAWLVLVVMLINLISPMTVWANEETEDLRQDNVKITEQTGSGVAETQPEGDAASETPAPEQTTPETEAPTPEAETPASEDMAPESSSAPETPTVPEEEPPAADKDSLLPEAEMQQVMAMKAPVELPVGTVTFSIETRTVDGHDIVAPCTVDLYAEDTVYTLLERYAEEHPEQIAVDMEGSFVTSIWDLLNEQTFDAGKYNSQTAADAGWMVSINNDITMGNAPTPQDGDIVRWHYTIKERGKDIILVDKIDELKEKVQQAQETTVEDEDQQAALNEALAAAENKLAAIDAYSARDKYVLENVIWGTAQAETETVTALLEDLQAALDGDYVVKVQSVVIDDPGTLYAGQTVQLTAAITPENATEQELEWEILFSGAEGTALSPKGLLTAGSQPGKVTVRATAKADSISSAGMAIEIQQMPDMAAAARASLESAASWLKAAHGGFESYNESIDSSTAAFLLARLDMMNSAESKAYYEALNNYVEADSPKLNYLTTWSGIVQSVNALGYSPQSIDGENYLDKILQFDVSNCDVSMCIAILKTLQGKDYSPANYTVETVVQKLLQEQAEDGGFESWGSSNVDVTGDALAALAAYRHMAGVETAIENAVNYLSQLQKEDGSFGQNTAYTTSNANSTGRALLGLASVGIDPLTDERFIKDNNNIIMALLNFQNEEGAFKYAGSSNSCATVDAMQGLSAYVRLLDGQEGLYDLTQVGISKEALDIQIAHAQAIDAGQYTAKSYSALTVAIKAAQVCTDPAQYTAVYNALKAAEAALRTAVPAKDGQVDLSGQTADKVGIAVKDSQPLTIKHGIGQAEAYLELADNQKMPQITSLGTLNGQDVTLAIPEQTTASAESILLPRAQDTRDTAVLKSLQDKLQSNVTVKQHIQVGGSEAITFDQFVTLTLSGAADCQAAYIDHDNKLHLIGTDAGQMEYYEIKDRDLVIHTKHFSRFVAYQTSSTGGGGSAPVVHITVDASRAAGSFGEISGTVAYYDGLDAVQALKNFVGEGNVAAENDYYVMAVKGLAQLDCGPESGWMYSVNGVFPEVGAQKLAEGDDLYWGYTLNMGADLKGGPAAAGGAAVVPITAEKREAVALAVDKALAKVQQAVLRSKDMSAWQAFGLAASGVKVPEGTYEALVKEVQAAKGSFRKVTDTEKMILAVTALGHDAAQIGGYDLIAAIYDHPDLTRQGSNGLTFALLALDSAAYSVPKEARWTREKLVSALLGEQNSDGGFALTKGSPSDVDLTAMALQALAPYRSQQAVNQSIDRALDYLSQAQREDGSFASRGVVNSESAAQVLLALTALEIDPLTDGRFIKDKVTVLDQLLAYQKPEGTFSHLSGGESDDMATEQGLLALTAMQRFLDGKHSIFAGFTVALAQGRTFTDSSLISPWAADAVQQALAAGYLAGYADGSFRPQQSVTRAEFTAMVLRAEGWSDNTAQPAPFQDTADKWYAQTAAAAYERGLIRGANGAFNGERTLTREEMAAMLCRAKGLSESAQPLDVSDQQAISPWAVGAVAAAHENGLLIGDGERIDPQGLVTREMAAATIWRLAAQH